MRTQARADSVSRGGPVFLCEMMPVGAQLKLEVGVGLSRSPSTLCGNGAQKTRFLGFEEDCQGFSVPMARGLGVCRR